MAQIKIKDELFDRPALNVHVVERGTHARTGWLPCHIGNNVEFSTAKLESYCIAQWEPIVYDSLLVAAAVEFGDRTQRRPAMSWARDLQLIVPVHDPDRWNDRRVLDALRDVLNFLTGDRWEVGFCKRRQALTAPGQGQFNLPQGLSAVIPFSDGLDSRCVGGLMARELGDKLIRVRLGSKTSDARSRAKGIHLLRSPTACRPGAKIRGIQCAITRIQICAHQRAGCVSGEGRPSHRTGKRAGRSRPCPGYGWTSL